MLKSFGDGKLISAIYAVLGKEFANSVIPVNYQLDSIKVSGYVSKPVHARANRNMQNFFINGRYVKSRTAMVALEEAFKGSVMVGKFPSCVLNIELPYEMIDVNVHPAKIEVRFVNERPIFDTIYHAVKSSLMKFDTKKQVNFKQESAFNDIKKFNSFHNAQAIIKKAEQQTSKAPSGDKERSNPFAELDINVNGDFSGRPEKRIQKNENKPIDNLKASDFDNPFDIYSSQTVNNEHKREKIVEQSKRSETFSHTDVKELKIPSVDMEIAAEKSANESCQNASEVTVVENTNSQPSLIESSDELRYIGEIFNTYIIVEKNKKDMLLIDKHAAHERIIYEKLKAEKAGASAQILLQPVAVTLGKAEYSAAISHLDMFTECSFEVEDFGNSTVIVRSAPQYIDASEIEDCITEMADYISMGKNDIFTEKMDWFYHNVACRSAIKAGNKNSAEELIKIVRTLEENPQIRYCPHGRPICVVMTKSEIEKQFGRA